MVAKHGSQADNFSQLMSDIFGVRLGSLQSWFSPHNGPRAFYHRGGRRTETGKLVDDVGKNSRIINKLQNEYIGEILEYLSCSSGYGYERDGGVVNSASGNHDYTCIIFNVRAVRRVFHRPYHRKIG